MKSDYSLSELGIISNQNKSSEIFEKIYPDIFNLQYAKPSEFIRLTWKKFESTDEHNNNLNGKIFEYLLAIISIREKLLPLYLSAKVAFVPNVIYDIMFYTKEFGPICWSVKTSLRERYKQADLESIALKYVHRKSQSYLITLNEQEAKNIKTKIKSGDVIGIDDVVVANSSDFDLLIEKMKKLDLHKSPKVEVIESNHIITTDVLDKI